MCLLEISPVPLDVPLVRDVFSESFSVATIRNGQHDVRMRRHDDGSTGY
jgi:hypothetical protein